MENKMQESQTVTQTATISETVDATFAESAKPTDKAVKADTEHQSRGVSWGFLFNLVFILLLLFATSSGGFYLYQELTLQKEKSAELALQLQQRLNDPVARITHLEQQQRVVERNFSAKLNEVTSTQNQVQEQVNKLAQRNPNHWMAEEAKYLMRMAGSKLWLENDPQTALALLEAADDRIETMKDPSLIPLRKALAQDMTNVAAIKTTDVAGTVLTLDTIINNLNALKLNRSESEITTTDDSLAMTESLDDWQSNLAKSWQALIEEFVVIRKRTTDHAPLLAPDQQWYLVENVRNKLLQAQLALLRQDQVNYRQSIGLARKWIFQYFDLGDQKTEQTLQALDALVTLELQTPSIQQFAATPLVKQLVTHGSLTKVQETPQ
ncbi:uroporphyrinogen III methylase [Shewanella colwelliana]|uniref:Uroporphyrinogen III methylase n=1 Tax=Shewanella colwelliana TaxID=23 RepID=A0ABQ4PAP4_SHECO|nr:uroporphyrinogen-III C-methyltransferase [Shewanella colwelliana]MDX1280197.1 uroporphyrinogen-III C-methyltransferase [Shewanella colwelliana]GIU22285.1 uroporphyrinogen III methylase [Shewanella colwelliana]GIU44459.1 uroporphyrinogen III methylase [Shewanella colwelliana]